jgi:hypothetical protein
MEPSSWPGHFRNLKIAQRELALPPSMGDDYNASFNWVFSLGADHLRMPSRKHPAKAIFTKIKWSGARFEV